MLKNIKIKKLLFFIVLLSFLISFFHQSRLVVLAQTSGEFSETSGEFSETSGEFSKTGSEKIYLNNPILGTPGSTTPSLLFARIIKVLLGVVGTLSLVVFIYGGILWLSSRGNQEQVQKGKNVFIYALVGLAVVFSSYAILNLVISALTG